VYAFLTFNIYLFFDEELAAAALQFPNGVAPVDIIEAYSATIDTLAWVVLFRDDRHPRMGCPVTDV
jgi:hypothetical protein